MKRVYHFTDTYRLPRILAVGELRPRKLIFNFRDPVDDFLWATTSARPEPTSGAVEHYVENYLTGTSRLVRFTLSAQDFVPFDEQIIVRHWGPNWVYLREREILDYGLLLVKTWRVRVGPLPLERVTGIEILARCGRWDPLTAGAKARMIEEGITEMLSDAHYAKKDEEDEDQTDAI